MPRQRAHHLIQACRAGAVVGVWLVCLSLASCGSRLSENRLEAANGAVTVSVDGRGTGGDSSGGGGGGGGGGGTAFSGTTDAVVGGSGGPASSGAGRTTTGGGQSTPRANANAGEFTSGTSGASGGASGGGKGAPAKPDLVFGSFGTNSGPIGALLAPVPTGLRAWMADVNARGGINGHKVRIVFADDGAGPGRAQAIAQRMVEKDKVIAFLGTYAAQTIQAVIPYLEKKKVPLIVPEGANVAEDHSPMVFMPQTSADVGNSRATLMSLVSLSEARKISIIACREVSTCPRFIEVVKEYAPKVGVEVVHEAQSSIAQPDYTAEMVEARNKGAEAVFLYFDNASTLRAVRSAHRQGWRPLFVGGSAVNDDSFVKNGKGDIDNFLSLSVTAPYSSSPLMRPYKEAVARYRPGGPLGGTGATAWLAGKLAERLGAYLPPKPASADVLTALYKMQNENVGGLVPTFSFKPGTHYTNMCAVPLKFSGERFIAPLGDRFVCANAR